MKIDRVVVSTTKTLLSKLKEEFETAVIGGSRIPLEYIKQNLIMHISLYPVDDITNIVSMHTGILEFRQEALFDSAHTGEDNDISEFMATMMTEELNYRRLVYKLENND